MTVVVLGKNAGRDIVRSVGFDYYFSVVVKVTENGCWCKCFFEEVEGCLLLWSPHKWNVFASLLFCHSGQRRHHFGVILYASSVKVGKPKETLDISDSPRDLPSQDTRYPLWVHPDSIGGDYETQIFHLLFVKMAFFRLQVQSGIRQRFQHLIHLFLVLFQGIAVNKDVVEKRGTKVIKVGSEHIVYEGLKIGQRFRQPGWYNQGFK